MFQNLRCKNLNVGQLISETHTHVFIHSYEHKVSQENDVAYKRLVSTL